MSYFCANTISFDKANGTFRVKGGSNNIVPRYNDWTGHNPLNILLSEVQGGGIQFTTKSEKTLHVQSVCDKYAAKLLELTGFTAWDLQYIIRGEEDSEEDIRNRHYFASGGTAEQFLEVFRDPIKVAEIHRLHAEFMREVVAPTPGGKYIVTNGQAYIARLLRTRATTTPYRDKAKTFGKLKAEELVQRFKWGQAVPA